ncbi:MAG: two-component regulator propeller domain-containing protein, partial [Anaerolineae bacterium]
TYVQYLRPQDPLAANTVRDIVVDSAGRKWLATAAGLTVFDDAGTPARDDDEWRTFTVANTFGGLPSDDVWALALQGSSIWVGTHQVPDMATKAWSGGGLGRLDGADTWDTADDAWLPIATYSSTRHTRPDATEVLGLVSDNIDDLVLTPQGRLWVATVRHRLLDTDAGTWPAVHGGISALDTQGTADPGDDVWAGASCEDQPLVVSCHVTALALDSDGWVWAGTRGRGAMFFRADGFTFGSDGDQRLGRGDGLPATDILAVALGPPGTNTVYLATTAGLAAYHHGGTVRDRRDDSADVLGGADLGRDIIQALALVGPVLWAGTGPRYGAGGGVVRLDPGPMTVEETLWTSAAHGGRAPASNFIRDIDFGSGASRWAGHVWIASGSGEQKLFGTGVMDLDTATTADPGDDAWATYDAAGTDDDGRAPWTGLPGNNVQAVAVDGDRVWLGAAEATWNSGARSYDDGGLVAFDGTRWTPRPATDGGLRSDSISSLALGCDGRLWVGTGSRWVAGQGVDILAAPSTGDPAADGWQAVSFPSLATNNTTGVAVNCDPETVWVSGTHQDRAGRWSDGGVARYEGATDTWTAFDTTNGLTSFAYKGIKAEAKSVLALAGGRALVGTYGQADTTQKRLIEDRPYWPAVL